MNLVGLDLNSTRTRAMIGPAGVAPQPLALDGDKRDLPTAISMQGRHLDVGRAGAALCRQLPYLVCENFLSRLGTHHEWSAGRHRIDASRALSAMLERIRSSIGSAKGLAVALPGYLSREQGEMLAPLAAKAQIPLLGSAPASIASALGVYKTHPWTGLGLFIDADDHALTCSVLLSTSGNGRAEGGTSKGSASDLAPTFSLVAAKVSPLPRLGLTAWKCRLVDGVSDRCIHHSRRDPRDSGPAEQMLFDQMEEVFEASRQEQMVELVVQGPSWCQNLILRPEEVRSFCTPLANQAAERIREVFALNSVEGIKTVLVSASAWRLPGLREIVQDEAGDQTRVVPLSADAAALGAHELAASIQRGDLPQEYLEAVVRCPIGVSAPSKTPERKKKLFRF